MDKDKTDIRTLIIITFIKLIWMIYFNIFFNKTNSINIKAINKIMNSATNNLNLMK
jgi:hypothetical protein